MKMQKILAITIAIFLCFTAVTAARTIGTFIDVKGKVYIQEKDSNTRISIQVGDSISADTYVYVLPGSSCMIEFKNKDVIACAERTKIYINDFFRNNRNESSVTVGAGAIEARITSRESGGSFTVYTPTAVAGVRGTEFEVAVGMDGGAMVDVNEGVVEVNNGADNKSLTEGDNVSSSYNNDMLSDNNTSSRQFINQSARNARQNSEAIAEEMCSQIKREVHKTNTLAASISRYENTELDENNAEELDQEMEAIAFELERSRSTCRATAMAADEMLQDNRIRNNEEAVSYLTAVQDINAQYQEVLDRIQAQFDKINKRFESSAEEIGASFDNVEHTIDSTFEHYDSFDVND